MTNYTVTATFTVRADSPAALQGIAALTGAAGGDERSQIEAAVNAGLTEVPGLVRRYGFTVTDASATVTPV